ncbi:MULTISPECIES: prolyl oligopeptidase family serine peptidase [unclassified Halomonas]|uniref:S9 family peptidase n=1 Tax=unclassified Halomonas TaxID=2609666 RepID=UPI0028842E2C|nr:MULTISPECIES: prolyl oligopeptidase family serine peptidase [unclassified Halomonas]MDT0502098.1 prolyl oligopeptidase family serine peptidase [Halomonas sp. PAR7]MDT0510892.1 prolyl oligopeptidase family serine peptidase [Halomonas sp. LES1]MDT0592784.1 prolyl oligopeptidase family serine peptidase [Halomonas sp. PAR8]
MKAQPPQRLEHPTASPASRFRRPEDPEWHWLEQREDSGVTDFLEAANAECDAWFSPLESLVERLYHGHLARRELAVHGLRTPLDHYTYWSETAADADYPVWWRHPNGEPDRAAPFLDLEARAAAHDFLELGDMALSPDERWLAWTEDTTGDERFDLFLVRLPDGAPVRLLEDIGAELSWAEDNVTLLFTRHDATQRPESIWRLGLDEGVADEPVLVLREEDPEFWLGLGKTRSREWLVLESASKDTSECHLIPARAPATPPRCFRPRESGVELALDHRPGHFYLLHNRGAPHFRLDRVPETSLEVAADTGCWQPLIPHRDHHTLEGIDAFSWGMVITERDHDQAQVHLRVMELDSEHLATRDERLPLPETPCSLALGDAPHFDSRRLRLCEESFILPASWVELDLDSGERRLLKQQPVHGDLKPEQLACERLWAISHDGERIPVSVVMRADRVGHPLPTLLYGYGAYGEVLDPWFSVARLELLSRGVAFAVAHVRGGGDRGEPWYLAGKLAHKANSFHDFLAARDALVEHGISDGERIAAYGASAGGLLVGASLNLAPQAFCAAVLDVPFVDVLRTMENPDLPLTTAEYTEWGNPADVAVRRRIADYSPLDNLAAAPYPALFLQGSWHDTRVPYWEPAKLYARLTELGSARGPVLLRSDMAAGHGGASGRFKAWHDGARQDAFILWALGLADQEA